MKTSETISEIAKALHKFHSEVGKIKKGSNNPFFKSKYAALPDILDVISEPMNKAELMIVQFPADNWGLTTRLLHTSGEYFEETYHMTPVKQTPQDAGSVITYQRRYAIGAILNLNIDEDDDGNKASQDPVIPKPKIEDVLKEVVACISTDALTKVWNKYPQLQKEQEFINSVKKHKEILTIIKTPVENA